MKLSVIVPVYNVEKYLPRCLDSLLRQGMEAEEYEVICVNDGSPDHSAAILAEYEANTQISLRLLHRRIGDWEEQEIREQHKHKVSM